MKKLMSFCRVPAFILAAMLWFPGLLNAQVRVTRVSSPDYLKGKSGIVYTLPGTRVGVGLSVVKTQEFAGPLSEFAGEFLGIDEVITKNSVSYALRAASLCSHPPRRLVDAETEWAPRRL